MDVKTILNIILIVLYRGLLFLDSYQLESKNISGKELKRMMGQNNKQFIDVRTAGEYRGTILKGFGISH